MFQLVCTDRRYARMNCFSIRELQSVLKRKFFNDLVGSHDYRSLASRSMIGLRFRLNYDSTINPDTITFHDLGLKYMKANKMNSLDGNSQDISELGRNTLVNFIDYELLAGKLHVYLQKKYGNPITIHYIVNLRNTLKSSFEFYCSFTFSRFFKYLDFNLISPKIVKQTAKVNLSTKLNIRFMTLLNMFFPSYGFSYKPYINEYSSSFDAEYSSTISTYRTDSVENETEFAEVSNSFSEKVDTSQRFNRFVNSLINYDYKTGNYVGH